VLLGYDAVSLGDWIPKSQGNVASSLGVGMFSSFSTFQLLKTRTLTLHYLKTWQSSNLVTQQHISEEWNQLHCAQNPKIIDMFNCLQDLLEFLTVVFLKILVFWHIMLPHWMIIS
jgi:hypothetical protein